MLCLFRYQCSLVLGILSIVLSIVFSIWTPFDLVMKERLEMRPGLPSFDWWLVPPQPTLKIYIFNVTNADDFLNGVDVKMRVEEVGPLVFKESWVHSNVVFNENSTITYNVRKTPIYDPSLNSVDLDSMVTMPNMAFLGSASYVWNTPFFVKYAFRSLVTMLGTKPFVNLTIRNLLYNFSDPLLKFANHYAPMLAPVDNMGIINNLYEPYGDNVTAFMGSARGHTVFSLIDRYNGEKRIPGHGDTCKDEITNGSEAVTFNQFISKGQDLRYYRNLLCRVVRLVYKEDVRKYGLTGYKFVVPPEVFDRTFPAENDCYKSDPPLFNGLSDLSNCLYCMRPNGIELLAIKLNSICSKLNISKRKCYHIAYYYVSILAFPLAGSFPHFLFGDTKLRTQVVGLTPNVSVHHSYVLVEPTTGIPMEEKAMIQLNVHVRPLNGFNKMLSEKFSDTIIPMFWLEFSMLNLPYYVLVLIYSAVILKYLQWVIVGAFLVCGLRTVRRRFSKEVVNGVQSENEAFLMKNIELRRWIDNN